MTTPKVTYVSLTADNEELQGPFDQAIERARGQLGRTYPLSIGGKERAAAHSFESRSPADTRLVVAVASSATATDVDDAVSAAKAAFPAWRATPWQQRAAIISRAAERVRAAKFDLAARLVLEMGKNRVEALGEIEEVADLYDYYVGQLEANQGFVRAMGHISPGDRNSSVLRPYGVWAVIAPWNFPYALLGAPIAAALLAGNTVVAKPSSETPLAGIEVVALLQQAGLPEGTLSLVTGSGSVVGDALALHPDVAGVTFTGSYDIGFEKLFQRFSTEYPKPCIAEMGGKNPAIVMGSADLDLAVQGVCRSAFGMGGQKCSACSRVYVERSVADAFLERLRRRTAEIVIGDPLERRTFLGPVATRAGYEDFSRYAAAARELGAVVVGGERLTEGPFERGYYVQPTIVTGIPESHVLAREELFLPFLDVEPVGSLDEALRRANDTRFGLTAGFFGARQEEVDQFLERIEAGVVYVNRSAGATTGAWPGVQPFGGWKGSGSTGKNIGGLYTLQCYLREQSRTICG